MSGVESLPIYDSAQKPPASIDETVEIFHYRNLVLQMVRRDIVARYKRSVLGVAWTMLNPLGMMIILSMVFSQIFKTDRTFPAYILSGIIAWNFFSITTTEAMVNLIGGVTLLQRIYMPHTVFAVSSIGNGLFNLVVSLVPLIGVMLVIGEPIHWSFLFFPIPVLLIAFFSLGLGLLLSTLAVYFRDVVAMYQIVLTAWMYLTPVMYPENVLPANLRFWITVFNPMYALIRLFRIPIYEGRLPLWGEFWPGALISLGMLIVGWLVFTRKSHEFAYRI